MINKKLLKEIVKNVVIEYNKIIKESINRNDRKVLFVDQDGKNIVYDDGEYRIAVDSPNDCRYVTLWHKEIIKEKEYWAKRGALTANVSERRFDWDKDFQYYLSIGEIAIEREFRGKGYGSKMYDVLIKYSNPKIVGLYSYLPNRVNKQQVPSIYRKYNPKIVGDYQVILF